MIDYIHASIKDIQAIMAKMPEYKKMVQGDVFLKCEEFSQNLCGRLHENKIEALHVTNGSHDYVLCDSDQGPIVVDPTFRQYFPEYEGWFIGSKTDLDAYVEAHDFDLKPKHHGSGDDKKVSDMWRNQILKHHVTPYIHEGQKQEFQEKWGVAGLCQFPEYMPENKVQDAASAGRVLLAVEAANKTL